MGQKTKETIDDGVKEDLQRVGEAEEGVGGDEGRRSAEENLKNCSRREGRPLMLLLMPLSLHENKIFHKFNI